MPKLHAVLFGSAALICAGAAIAAAPVWHTTTVDLPDGSQAEIQYVGEIPPKVSVSMPVVQDTTAPAGEVVEGEEVSYGGIPRARRVIQPPTVAPAVSQPVPPQFVVAGDAPKGSTYEYTLITTGADGRVCAQRTEWKSRGKGKEPQVTRSDHGEGCATLNAAPPAPQQTVPADPNAI